METRPWYNRRRDQARGLCTIGNARGISLVKLVRNWVMIRSYLYVIDVIVPITLIV